MIHNSLEPLSPIDALTDWALELLASATADEARAEVSYALTCCVFMVGQRSAKFASLALGHEWTLGQTSHLHLMRMLQCLLYCLRPLSRLDPLLNGSHTLACVVHNAQRLLHCKRQQQHLRQLPLVERPAARWLPFTCVQRQRARALVCVGVDHEQ